jgi:adenine-specific DNA-methyltransferase
MTDEPETVDLETPDLAAEHRAALARLFPGVLADGVLDATKLGELLDVRVAQAAEGRERYGLQWAGKAEAVRSLLTPGRGTLVPDTDASIGFDDAENVFIEGDNLEVLKLLQKSYNDRIKLIYIDPPYNTGSDFVYRDDFSDGLRGYLEYTGQLDDAGNRVSADVDARGRRHSRWLSMMYPRLILARNLLTPDGVMFVSIDDNEVQNLRAIMDEVFGAENFVASIVWQKRYSRENRGAIGDAHEYLLIYARNRALFEAVSGRVQPTEKQTAVYKNPNNDPRGRWRPVPMTAQGFRPNQMYEVVTPSGVRHTPPDGRCWGMTEPEYLKLREAGRIYFGKNNDGQPNVIRYLDEVDGFVPWTWWPSDEVGHTDEAAKEVRAIFGTQTAFDTAKPVRLLRRVVEIGLPKDGIVLDFFAGSGTIGHAIAAQNAEDGQQRRFIAVQLPETSSGAKYEKVSDVTLARLHYVVDNFDEAREQGLRVLRLEPSNFIRGNEAGEGELNLATSTLIDGANDPSRIAAEVLLKEGVSLDASWAAYDLGEVSVQVSGGVAVVIGEALDIAAADQVFDLDPKPHVVVFLEDDLAGQDALKANLLANAKTRGITVKTV